jgi:hypothetical protein
MGLILRVISTLILIALCVGLVHQSRHLLWSVVGGGLAIAAGSLVLMFQIVAEPKQGA